ncbi:hypothetical protein F5Y17DRAFT_461640 [Xylariaceae sp. FL0594]|nr:hypothetical protein F5Y17DRAFT_461640 [Xylariaceae sp. FL0594]
MATILQRAVEEMPTASQSKAEQAKHHAMSLAKACRYKVKLMGPKYYDRISRRGIMIKSAITILWPILTTFLYVFIACFYLLRDNTNGIIEPPYCIDAKGLFYAWFVLSILVLEWMKTSLSWFEAVVISNYPSWAPSSMAQIDLHIDYGWSRPRKWYTAMFLTCQHIAKRGAVPWQGPGPLWWYSATTYILFVVAITLSGLSMEAADALKLGRRPVTIFGVNVTTFDVRATAKG